MKKVYSISLGMLFSVSAVFAQTTKSLLWKIEGNELSKPSYVFGTIHLKDSVFFNVNDSLDAVTDRVDVIAGELNMLTIDPSAILGKVRMKESNKVLLTGPQYNKLHQELGKLFPVQALPIFDSIAPAFLESMLLEINVPGNSSFGIDAKLQYDGKAAGKEIVGVETMEDQINALMSLGLKDQAKELASFLDEKEEAIAIVNKMRELYLDQDIEGLFKMMLEEELSDEFMQNLLYSRNLGMVESFIKLSKQKSVLLAVGAAHLPADKGVLALLKEKGYSVTPVR